jgi:cytochrome b involved in lipid metabolism
VLRKQTPFKEPKDIIDIKEFNNRISKGEKLVILDDLVLNVCDYMAAHPGGKFALLQNVGRDVSKFFHGGYTLEPSSG